MSTTTTPAPTPSDPATAPGGPMDMTETFMEGIESIRMKLIDKVLAYNGLTMAGRDRGAEGIVAAAMVLEAYVTSPSPSDAPPADVNPASAA